MEKDYINYGEFFHFLDLPAFLSAIATAILIAFFLDFTLILPILPSFFQSSTISLIFLLITFLLDPLFRGIF